MLILKGESGKGRIISEMLAKTNSICFTYSDYPVNCMTESYYVDSKNYSLDDLMLCITEHTETYPERYYDYFIIYTNNKEEELKDFIAWLKYVEYFSRNVLVTCR